jgi:fluoroacetyl-CoA thioesterase
MKSTLTPGLSVEVHHTVDDTRAISFMGDELRVYATPCIVHDLEYACRDLILEHLEEGQDSVGARVEIEHLKPTPMGLGVRHVVTVDEVDGRSVTCSVTVHDDIEKVATARHTRFIIDVARLKKMVAQKRDANGGLAG